MTPRKPTRAVKDAGKKAKAAPRRRTGRPTLLNEQRMADLCNFLRAGCFGHVAAQAVGIAPSTFREWLARGEGRDPDRAATTEYAVFAAEVRRNMALARVSAENRVFSADPLAYLRLGPGRDRGDPDEPGWTEQVAVTGNEGGPLEVVVTYENDWRDEAQ